MRGTLLKIGFGRWFTKSIAFALALLIAFGSPALIFAQEVQQTDITSTTVSEPTAIDTATTQVDISNITTTSTQDSITQDPTTNTTATTPTINQQNTGVNTTQNDTIVSTDPQTAEALSTSENDLYRDRTRDVVNAHNVTPDMRNGSLQFEYPIAVPPGRNELTTPDFKLIYNSQGGDDISPYGYGWSDNIPFIERVNKKESINSIHYMILIPL